MQARGIKTKLNNMLDIKNFFQKFAKIQADNWESKGVVIKAVKKVCGLDIEAKNFVFENGILRFNLSPVLKSEIFMHKTQILSELNSTGSLVKDIR